MWFLLFFLPLFGFSSSLWLLSALFFVLYDCSMVCFFLLSDCSMLCFLFSLIALCFGFSSLYCDFYVKLSKNLCFLACIFFSSLFSLPCLYLMNLCPQMYLYLTVLYSIFTPLIYLLSRPHSFVFFFVIFLFEYNILLYLYFHISDIFPALVVFHSFNYLQVFLFNYPWYGIFFFHLFTILIVLVWHVCMEGNLMCAAIMLITT